ncbi:Ff.00g080440.m01.CDS01 [Fusarium sp. VM40]|nr:Ff.00g080440.m01.CDS01 [Fusarium sp. VM40]
MAEIIGVAASATQLGIACFSLIDIVRKIKGGASTLERYHEQLQELQSISTCISQNPLLQTAEIGTQTDALLYIINNNRINSLLRKGRVLRTWGFLYREQDLLDIFVRLERQKSNLSLAIEQIQSKALYQIQTDIQNMAEKNTDTKDEKKPSGSPKGSRTLGNGEFPPYTASSNPHFEHLYFDLVRSFVPTERQTSYLASFAASFKGQESSTNSNNRTTQADQTRDAAPEPTMGGIWNCPIAPSGYLQVNGNNYDIDGLLSRELARNAPRGTNRTRSVYNNPIKTGNGDQHNGNYIVFDDVTGATEPEINATYNHPICIPASFANPGQIVGRQINGNTIIRKHTAGARSDKK